MGNFCSFNFFSSVSKFSLRSVSAIFKVHISLFFLKKKNYIYIFLLTEYMITSNMPDSERLSVVLGQEVRFWCGVTTKRRIEITFQWFKFLRDRIVTNPHLRTWKRDIYNNLSNTSVQKGYLKIHGARYSDSGPYTCEAKGNGESIMTKSVVLTIQGIVDV